MAIMSDRVIGDQGLLRTAQGLAIEVRLPWYRSLPLSTVEIEQVEIDGRAVDLAGVSFSLEGRTYPLAALEEQTEHVWYVLDSAYLMLDGLELGDGPHQVSVTMVLYPPYIVGLRRPTRETRACTLSPEHANV